MKEYMKKHLLLFVVLSAVLAPLLVSCSEAGSSVIHTVTFHSGEGSDVSPQSVQSGGTADRPAAPRRSGYAFVVWYSDAGFQTVYDFDQPVTESITLYAQWVEPNLKGVVSAGIIPADLSEYDSLVQTILEPYAANAAIVARYVDVTAQGAGDASSWDNAAGDIKATMDDITGADADTVYLVLVASGTHTPTDTLAMKNHMAIVGGWNEWEQSGISTISGSTAGQVFSNNGIDRTALLYGVTIANGHSNHGDGGGMRNEHSSPTLINVVFANHVGDGMYNNYSSPTLVNVVFVNNRSFGAGGMVNELSSPTLINVTFSGNTGQFTGGMLNHIASSPTLINVTFVNNKSTSQSSGGMLNDNGGGGEGPTIVNTLFWNNTGKSQATAGGQIRMNNGASSGAENMTISFSLVQHGIEATVGATADDNTADGLSIDGGSDSVTITQAHNISGDPKLAADLADNGGFVQTIALLDNSAAADAGAYVQRSGTPGSFTFYYSEDNADWFSDAALSSSGPAPPAGALDLTATDARGYARTDRPDIGAYEYGGTAP